MTSITILRMSFRFQNSTLLGRFSAVLYVSLFLFPPLLVGLGVLAGLFYHFMSFSLSCFLSGARFFLCSALLGGVFFYLYLPIASSYIVVSFYAFFFYFFLFF